MRHDLRLKAHVTFGDGVVLISRPGSSRKTEARILGGREKTKTAPQRIYLDRLVHYPYEKEFEGWRVTGAVSTILEQMDASDAPEERTI